MTGGPMEIDHDLDGPRLDADARSNGRGVDICGEMIACPECGETGEAAFLRVWGEGVDADFHCNECGASAGVR